MISRVVNTAIEVAVVELHSFAQLHEIWYKNKHEIKHVETYSKRLPIRKFINFINNCETKFLATRSLNGEPAWNIQQAEMSLITSFPSPHNLSRILSIFFWRGRYPMTSSFLFRATRRERGKVKIWERALKRGSKRRWDKLQGSLPIPRISAIPLFAPVPLSLSLFPTPCAYVPTPLPALLLFVF